LPVAERRWLDPALAGAATALGLIGLASQSDVPGSPLAVALLVAMGAMVAFRRTHPLAAIAVATLLLLVAGVAFDGNYPPTSAILIPVLLSYSCGAHARFGDGLIAVLGLIAASQVAMGFSEFPNAEILFVTLAPWWVGWEIGKRRRLVAELERRTHELEEAQDEFVELSLRRERARIARELHDIVAHHLAIVVVQAGAGRMTGARAETPPGERLTTIRQSGEQALAELARLVDLIQADTRRAGADRLSALLGHARAGGLDIEMIGEQALPPELEDDALSVLQEALTNAVKHTPGARVTVRLTADNNGCVEVDVRSLGGGPPTVLAHTGAGLGLTGMRERIEALGGTLEAGPGPDGGWRVRAQLPPAPTPVG
jgi:signal transduction histidine kinase